MFFTNNTNKGGSKFFTKVSIVLLLLNLPSFSSLLSAKSESKLYEASQTSEYYSVSASQVISLTFEKKNSLNEQVSGSSDAYIGTVAKKRITTSLSILSKSFNGAIHFNFFITSHFASST